MHIRTYSEPVSCGHVKRGMVFHILHKLEDKMYLHDCSFLSPGISAEDEVDEQIKKTCGDADVFVYVCNGRSTLEEPVIMQVMLLVYEY